MIYVFCDEDISSDSSYWVYLYSAVAFSQRRYNNSGFSRIERLREGGTSLLEPINEMLNETEGFALLSQARVPKSLLPTDLAFPFKTGDIPSMSPKDFVWSLSMMFTVAYLVRRVLEQRWNFKTADVFYDPRSLSKAHKCAMTKYLQDKLRLHIKHFLRSTKIDGNVNVRRVEAVKKSKPKTTPDKFQLGTWLADRIVRRYSKIVNMKRRSLIETRDITQDVVDTLKDFLDRGHPILKENQSDAH